MKKKKESNNFKAIIGEGALAPLSVGLVISLACEGTHSKWAMHR